MEFIDIPNMLLIGATGRNVGKTTLACALIERLRQEFTVIGVKITAADDEQGQSRTGSKGCGSCDDLQGPYEIIEERNAEGKKDTCLMLQARAAKVYWVKSLRSHLSEAVTALLSQVGPDCVLVCESTGLRTLVRPGLFLLADNAEPQSSRPSAEQVRQWVDRVVCFEGQGFDVDLDSIRYDGEHWHCPAKASCIILAGGRSRRMGQDKSLLPVEGKPMIQHVLDQVRPHFDEIIVSSNTPEVHQFPGVKTVSDQQQGRGPLMGIASALQVSSHDTSFVVACDMPNVDTALMRQMLRQAYRYDVVLPRSGKGFLEPLFAVYNRPMLSIIEEQLAQGNNKAQDVVTRGNVLYVDLTDTQQQSLLNLNTKPEYLRFRETDAARQAETEKT